MKFHQIAKYSIKSRGIFLLVKNMSDKKISINDIPETVEVDCCTKVKGSIKTLSSMQTIYGFDFPSKISRTYLKTGDIIGVQIETF